MADKAIELPSSFNRFLWRPFFSLASLCVNALWLSLLTTQAAWLFSGPAPARSPRVCGHRMNRRCRRQLLVAIASSCAASGGCFIQRDFLDAAGLAASNRQPARHFALGLGHLVEQIGGDGEQVAAGKQTSARPCGSSRPSPGLVAELLVVVIDARHGTAQPGSSPGAMSSTYASFLYQVR